MVTATVLVAASPGFSGRTAVNYQSHLGQAPKQLTPVTRQGERHVPLTRSIEGRRLPREHRDELRLRVAAGAHPELRSADQGNLGRLADLRRDELPGPKQLA